jgi:predicted transcriptional regulator
MKELIEKYNMRKIDASTKMELTPAAITQYLKGERGTLLLNEIGQDEEVMKGVSKLADALAKGDASIENVVEQLCEICTKIRSEEIICELHRKDLPTLKEFKCSICERSA